VKAVRVHAIGGPEVMNYEEVDVPRPGPGEVLVKITATGLNYLDVQYRIGRLKVPLPFTNGTEAAGVVSEVGSGVTDVKVGDRVAYTMILGTYAEYAIAPAARLVPVPADLDLRVAAAALLQGLTAHYLTHSTYPLKAGETAIVHAAAGGIGNVLTQVARLVGARVIATVGSDAKVELARQAGAHHVINYSTQDFEQEVKKLTDGRGVDVVYDSVGRTRSTRASTAFVIADISHCLASRVASCHRSTRRSWASRDRSSSPARASISTSRRAKS
jgi:NADPH2:quinone reductase